MERKKKTQELDEGDGLTLCSAMVTWTTSLHIWANPFLGLARNKKFYW